MEYINPVPAYATFLPQSLPSAEGDAIGPLWAVNPKIRRALKAIVTPCLDLLGPGGRFLQITNAFTSPLPIDELGIAGKEICRVWLTCFPPRFGPIPNAAKREAA
jgi:hypothetical protein